ncbi:hypothetical protein [Rhodohalobacter sulfatireducens]|uniref:Uncharacterized protein n=1 Tax=Rhodohalobacter sulfatireducens TaxID=2911366 RepID=A0ABS9KIE1_9BACT|nr:hypothetical protein [Rhodohalobacter sulfatireducens]MCG2590557.1 hypothetical protein [Rhodohalobacter sulfatireducens]MDR9365844.1 hypothetical protein [Balneolaceae bacterium]MDR9410224.1 hypothetical protein [Balneolaceae bacterium]
MNNYNTSEIADNTQLKKIGESIETRYILKIHMGNLNCEVDTETNYID